MISLPDAIAQAKSVYEHFLECVVKDGVFSAEERTQGDGPLSDGKQKRIAEGRARDIRTPHLAAVSGKGAPGYPEFTNVTLIDHLVSVTRGSLVFAALDLTSAGVVTRIDELRSRLTVVAAVAFLHDIDKMLGLGRIKEILPEHVETALQRYRVRVFLDEAGISLQADELLALIHDVEVSRTGFLRRGFTLAPRRHVKDCLTYVKLADRLDGTFLGPGDGISGMLKELQDFDMHSEVLKHGWKVLRIEDPHTPFLLDALLVSVSRLCETMHGFPPLIEIHHDGVFLAIVPEERWEDLVEQALARATSVLGAAIRPEVNTRGAIDLLDAPGTLDKLRDALLGRKPGDRARFLYCQVDILRERMADIDAAFAPFGYQPAWGPTASGRLIPMWSGTSRTGQEDLDAFLLDAETLAILLCCSDPEPKARRGIPPAETREAELRAHLGDLAPAWIDEISDGASRRMILAALAAACGQADSDLRETLLGFDGLAALWLSGRDGRPGLAAKIDASGVRLAEAVRRHYSALLRGDFVAAEDEDAPGRCHFTNQPVPIDRSIDGKVGLYGVKISAFSGRDSRFEHFTSMRSHTLVAPIAEAEHRLRQIAFDALARGRGGDVPALLSSPTTAGLFGALVFKQDRGLKTFALTDLLREKRDDDKPIFDELDPHYGRVRVARYETLPTKLVGDGKEFGQLEFLLAIIRVARRLGRPMHLFRGLPRPNRAFIHFDFLPPMVESFLGGRSFRVEQLGGVVDRLEGLVGIAQTTGLGSDLALRIADPRTCFAGACDCLRRIEDKDSPGIGPIRNFVKRLLEQEEKLEKSETDRALVAFGEAVARIQRRRVQSDGGTFSETGLRTAIEAVEQAARSGQTDRESLVCAVAGELQKTIERRRFSVKASAREGLGYEEAFETAAIVFVDQVWLGAFKGVSPASAKRRVALSIFSWAFNRRTAVLWQVGRETSETAKTAKDESDAATA